MNINDTIKNNFKLYRKTHGFTLQIMADKCDLTKSQIWEIENKNKSMSVFTLEKLSKGTGLSITFLCGQVNWSINDELLFQRFRKLNSNNKCIAAKIMDLLKDWEFDDE